MRAPRSFRDLPIRYKLFLGISAAYVLTITLGSTIIYSLVRTTIQDNIESELKNSTSTILNMVRTSVEVSIKNHLRAVAEKNREIVAHFHKMYMEGSLSQEEAKRQAEAVLLSQKIGDTGYIYCLDSNGVVLVHPKKELINRNVSDYEFVREQMARKEGYMEYEWRNPGEAESRPKALYMTYFEPWDWIVSVSSYRSEFSTLVNVDDFRDSILSLRFGETGYSFVVDGKGNLVLHPKIGEENYLNVKDAEGRSFMKEICEQKSGKIVYSWMNPGETVARKKLAMFNTIPELDWIVASSSYLDEFYAPLYSVRDLFAGMVVLSLLLVLPLTGRISAAITNPLQELMNRFAAGIPGDFSARVDKQSGDELGQLASYFNLFMGQLEQYNQKLQGEIAERKQAEEGLRLSEEMFSKAFRSSPNGICIISLADGRFINVNDTFLVTTGYRREEIIDKNAMETAILGDEHKVSGLIEQIDRRGHVHNQEIEIFARSGQVRLGMLSAEAIEIRNERCMLLTIEDVTDRKHLEREIMEIGDRERQRIGQDLHDDLCAHLIGIEVLSEVLNRKLEEKSSEDAAFAGRIRVLISEVIEKARRLARGLCPVHLVAYGLESALRELCINYGEVFDTSCELRSRDTVLIHDNAVATHLFYIAREAVQNAFKHAEADRIIIDLSSDDGLITLRVTDNGSGMREATDAKGMGLRIMSHRAKMIGASLDIRGNPAGGTIVECSIRDPIRKEAPYDSGQG
jgi:PAS domain S-box-containing protein